MKIELSATSCTAIVHIGEVDYPGQEAAILEGFLTSGLITAKAFGVTTLHDGPAQKVCGFAVSVPLDPHITRDAIVAKCVEKAAALRTEFDRLMEAAKAAEVVVKVISERMHGKLIAAATTKPDGPAAWHEAYIKHIGRPIGKMSVGTPLFIGNDGKVEVLDDGILGWKEGD